MSLKHATLIALVENDATGYEIAKWFDEGLGYFWQASHQQIYLELSKMNKLGLVSFKEQEQSGKPTKKIYKISKAGKDELISWLSQPTPRPVYKDAILMKVFAGHLISPTLLLKEIESQRASFLQSRAELEQVEKTVFADGDDMPLEYQYMYLTLRNGLLQTDAFLLWADEVIAFLKKQKMKGGQGIGDIVN